MSAFDINDDSQKIQAEAPSQATASVTTSGTKTAETGYGDNHISAATVRMVHQWFGRGDAATYALVALHTSLIHVAIGALTVLVALFICLLAAIDVRAERRRR